MRVARVQSQVRSKARALLRASPRTRDWRRGEALGAARSQSQPAVPAAKAPPALGPALCPRKTDGRSSRPAGGVSVVHCNGIVIMVYIAMVYVIMVCVVYAGGWYIRGVFVVGVA
jgi:hypothetical protein